MGFGTDISDRCRPKADRRVGGGGLTERPCGSTFWSCSGEQGAARVVREGVRVQLVEIWERALFRHTPPLPGRPQAETTRLHC